MSRRSRAREVVLQVLYQDDLNPAHNLKTADDFIRHLAAASTGQSKEIVIASFNSFLEQAGLPLVEIATECKDNIVNIHLKQSRYFPLGSKGNREQQWTMPVCLRLGNADETSTSCLLLTEKEQVQMLQF